MNIVQYVPLALRTEKPLPIAQRMDHACLGLITESGEIVTVVKRVVIYNKELTAELKQHLCEEVGDLMWYFAILGSAIGSSFEKLDAQPRMPRSQDEPFELTVMSMIMGKHVGHICHEVMACELRGSITEHDAGVITASMAMLLEACKIIADMCGTTLEQCLIDNIRKLQIRYPDKYSDVNAEARADKAGADARNS